MLQVTVEIPYVFLQAILFTIITYPAIDFYWSAYKVFWYFYCTPRLACSSSTLILVCYLFR